MGTQWHACANQEEIAEAFSASGMEYFNTVNLISHFNAKREKYCVFLRFFPM